MGWVRSPYRPIARSHRPPIEVARLVATDIIVPITTNPAPRQRIGRLPPSCGDILDAGGLVGYLNRFAFPGNDR